MNQKQLEIFTTLANNLNFSKTAEQLFLSQTTVSLQIKSLETELNVKLFDRTSRNVQLTYAGKVFFDASQDILNRMDLAVSQVTDAAKGYTGQLKLGYADDVNAAGISEVLKGFLEVQPKIRLHITGGYPSDLLNKLFEGECDLIFIPAFLELERYKLNYVTLKIYDLVAAVNKDHPFANKDFLRFTDFEDENFFIISSKEQNFDFSTYFLKYLNQAGVHVNIASKIDNIETVFLMIESGMGITVLPEYFKGRFSGTSRIRTVNIRESLPPTEFIAVWKVEKPKAELSTFLEYAGYIEK